MNRLALAAVLAFAWSAPALAERAAVLKQIELPHNYYFREMYLPQVTGGPEAPTFSPDGKSLIYAMSGSLWRQQIGGAEAVEITHSAGYDHQPDWSHDGRSVVFTRYHKDAMELWRLDLATARETQLTSGGAVNLEPRWSPDGKTLAFVSTKGTGHFVLHAAPVTAAGLGPTKAVVADRKSKLKRYYYSAFDHAISPSWTPDGKRIAYVSNRETAHGSGGIWSVAADGSDEPRRLHDEETNWRASPDVAPDGKRIIYSSYHGRQWHQLWLATTAEGGTAYPLTFGEFDRTEARWSPDGKRIAFVSNQDGQPSLWVQTFAGGALQRVEPRVRRYKVPRAELRITARDAQGRPAPARISVLGADGRAYAPDKAWSHADDSYDRDRQASETRYFHCPGACAVPVPLGKATVSVGRGPEFSIETRTVEVGASGAAAEVTPWSLALPAAFGSWVSADLHVHMNYGGRYRATPETLAAQARAEGLDVVYNLVVNKEQRVPDIAGFSDPPRAIAGVTILQAQEHHSSYWGHMGLLHLGDHFVTPDFTAYDGTALASAWPYNGVIAAAARDQGGLVGYVHPFDFPVIPDKDPVLNHVLPADVAMGKVDYYEVVGFSDHRITADIWHRLLNLGFRVSAGAGTDAMSNFASLRGPVGVNRVYLDVEGDVTADKLKAALKAGRTFATNGPLVGLRVEGKAPGDEIRLGPGPQRLKFKAALRSNVPLDHFELIHNGKVLRTLPMTQGRHIADVQDEVVIPESGWITLRAHADKSDPRILDLYPYGETGPVYVTIEGSKPRFPEDAAYFIAWIDRVIASADARTDYNTEAEKAETLAYLRHARAVYERLR